MSEDGWGGNPYPVGSIGWYIWNKYIGPHVFVGQKVVSEKELASHLLDGSHVFVQQLQSGNVVVAKIADMNAVISAGKQSLAKGMHA